MHRLAAKIPARVAATAAAATAKTAHADAVELPSKMVGAFRDESHGSSQDSLPLLLKRPLEPSPLSLQAGYFQRTCNEHMNLSQVPPRVVEEESLGDGWTDLRHVGVYLSCP